MKFKTFFRALWGFDPFPWQVRLAGKIEKDGRWPTPLGLPTASGKTAIIDIAVFALAMGWPVSRRRIFFCVDRRVVVDEAGDRAKTIAKKIYEAKGGPLAEIKKRLIEIGGTDDFPIQTSTLRGAQMRNNSWAKSPVQPLICSTTVDQIGSKLLFRAYGCKQKMAPVHAGLVSYDSLILLDEAHLSQPFSETLDSIKKYIDEVPNFLPKSLTFVELSATSAKPPEFTHDKDDEAHPVLRKRLFHPKNVELRKAKDVATEMSKAYGEYVKAQAEPQVVGIIANTVKQARAVWKDIKKKHPQVECLFFNGQSRAFDRDRLWQHWKQHIEAKADRPNPPKHIVVVATQCIEAGANIDFDFLITECAPLDALKQRFGRLNRMGNKLEASAIIIVAEVQVTKIVEKTSTKEKKVTPKSAPVIPSNPIYGEAIFHVWQWLQKQTNLDFSQAALSKIEPKLCKNPEIYTATTFAASLLPAHVDFLAQKNTHPSPDLEPFLKGVKSKLQKVSVIWRKAFNDSQPEDWAAIMDAIPPSTLETADVPIYLVRSWLDAREVKDAEDIEGVKEVVPKLASKHYPVLMITSEESKIIRSSRQLKANSILVIPSKEGGCDEWGWNPESVDHVIDISEECLLKSRGFLFKLVTSKALDVAVNDENTTPDEIIKILKDSATKDSDETLLTILKYPRLIEYHYLSNRKQLFAISSAKRITKLGEQEEFLFRPTRQVSLAAHQKGVASKAKAFAELIFGKSDPFVELYFAAGIYHDVGKLDPRCQEYYHHGDKFKVLTSEPLAKSFIPKHQDGIFRSKTGYVLGIRHEIMSVALLEHHPKMDDFILHLIASHHGHARPMAPIIKEDKIVNVSFTDPHTGQKYEASSDHRLEALSSPLLTRFAKANKKYGWWGLAYLETIFRLADHRQSEEEQE